MPMLPLFQPLPVGILLCLLVLLSPIILYIVAYQFLYNNHVQEKTGIPDLALLGKERRTDEKIKGTAVICGGSVAGLTAARICHDHFARVIIIEPEAWLNTEDGWINNVRLQKNTRSRVAQYFQFHLYHIFTYLFWEKIFENVKGECELSGVKVISKHIDIRFSGFPVPSPLKYYKGQLPENFCSTRRTFEAMLRRMVIGRKKYPNLTQLLGTVIGIESDAADPSKISRVKMRTADGIQEIDATLVVDCTGSTSAGFKWLERAGYGTTDTNTLKGLPLSQLKLIYDPKMQYTTLNFYLSPENASQLNPLTDRYPDGRVLFFPKIPMDNKVFMIHRIERDIVQILCGAWGNQVKLPNRLDGIKEYINSLNVMRPMPDWVFEFLDLLASFNTEMTAHFLRVSPRSYIPYQKAENMPSNFIAIGDSIMQVNPIFAQGISKANLGVASLNTVLHQVQPDTGTSLPNDFSKRFFEKQAGKIEHIWYSTKALDYGSPTTIPIPGEDLSNGWFLRWYGSRINLLSTWHERTTLEFYRSRQFLAPGLSLFNINTVLQIMSGVVKDWMHEVVQVYTNAKS